MHMHTGEFFEKIIMYESEEKRRGGYWKKIREAFVAIYDNNK